MSGLLPGIGVTGSVKGKIEGKYIYITSGSSKKMWVSSDFGVSFTEVLTFSDIPCAPAISNDGKNLLIGGINVINPSYSTNYGLSWTTISNYQAYGALGISGNGLVMAYVPSGDTGSLRYSINGGVNWNYRNNCFMVTVGGSIPISINYDGSIIQRATYSKNLNISTTGVTGTFSLIALSDYCYWITGSNSGNDLYYRYNYKGDGKLYYSSNGGTSFNLTSRAGAATDFQDQFECAHATPNKVIVYSIAENKIYLTDNYGSSWSTVYSGTLTSKATWAKTVAISTYGGVIGWLTPGYLNLSYNKGETVISRSLGSTVISPDSLMIR